MVTMLTPAPARSPSRSATSASVSPTPTMRPALTALSPLAAARRSSRNDLAYSAWGRTSP